MKAAVLCVLLLAAIVLEINAAANKPGFQCHSCAGPPACKKWNISPCKPGQNVCQRTHRAITDPSGTENDRNDYASTTRNVMVWERLCTTMKECENAQKRQKKLGMVVTCCTDPLCNA